MVQLHVPASNLSINLAIFFVNSKLEGRIHKSEFYKSVWEKHSQFYNNFGSSWKEFSAVWSMERWRIEELNYEFHCPKKCAIILCFRKKFPKDQKNKQQIIHYHRLLKILFLASPPTKMISACLLRFTQVFDRMLKSRN